MSVSIVVYTEWVWFSAGKFSLEHEVVSDHCQHILFPMRHCREHSVFSCCVCVGVEEVVAKSVCVLKEV